MYFRVLVIALLSSLLFSQVGVQAADKPLYRSGPKQETRWVSFENPKGAKGQGGRENLGGKGHAFDSLAAGQTRTLLAVQGSGIIQRMWFTLRERDPQMLRALRLNAYWDNAETPAVSVPFGDFLGAILGQCVPFESEFFSNPEGRSFNVFIPMPFRKAAKITITNDSERDVRKLFYEINYTLTDVDADALYFHAYWRRERWTQVGRDFEILPSVKGHGRYLGAHIGVIVNRDNVGWWGEGEVKVFLDGDGDYPTLVQTGTEDYIGTGWGQGGFHHRYHGSLVSDAKTGQFSFYRYHVPDPVFFHQECRVTIQQMGGTFKNAVLEMLEKGVRIRPVSVERGREFIKLLEPSAPDLTCDTIPARGWTNYFREDDFSAVAFFYLDSPENGLPAIAGVEKRCEALTDALSVSRPLDAN